MTYQLYFRNNGTFNYAVNDGVTVYVRLADGSEHPDYNPKTHSGAAKFLATNPDLRDRAVRATLPETDWDAIINGLLINTSLWDIFSRYEGLNLSPRKRMNAISTQLILLRLPGLLPQFIASWNGIITEIRANIIAVRPTAAEITSINAVLIANNAPFRMDANGFFV